MRPSGARTMLITGATGFIGSRLAALASLRGYTVRTLTRSDWAGVPGVPVDQRFFGELPERIPLAAFRGAHVVVHCAAKLAGGERAELVANVDGTARLAELAKEAGVQTLIFLSSQSAKPDAPSSYGRTKYLAEQRLLAERGLHVIILRPGLVTGPGSRGLYQRMVRLVETMPVIPLLGGGESLVQAIHVDDLCAAIIRCDQLAPELRGSVLSLGDPEGVTLAEFLRTVAAARLGKSKRSLNIPLKPIELLVRGAEALRLPLPVNSNNLRGLKAVERMDTSPDLERLGLRLRPLAEMIRLDEVRASEAISPEERAVRILLVGAGRIGLVHALTLSRLPGVVLAGVVDSSSKATGFLQGLGLYPPFFARLDDALDQVKPDAVVVATPASTHLSLTQACLARGLVVLTEKPLAISSEQLGDYRRLAEQCPDRPVQVGYVMLRSPQVVSCLARLRAGEFGRPRGFLGLTLLSLIQERGAKRWEVDPRASGGGALINAGSHVLSMIRAAFGEPVTVEAETMKIYSTEVEDSIAVTYTFPEISGRHYCTWSIAGFPRQDNTLIVWTDTGRLILTTALGAFVPADGGEIDVTHQLDFDMGFNLAPDYAGGGFAAEMGDLAATVRSGKRAPVDLPEAIRLEGLLFDIYRWARDVTTFATPEPTAMEMPGTRDEGRGPREEQSTIQRVLDLRDLSTTRVHVYLAGRREGPLWNEYLLAPSQMAGLDARWATGEQLRVTVPDFLTQSRLISNGRHLDVLRQMGLGGVLAAGREALAALPRERGVTFWVAARSLLAAALAAVPASFRGTLLLHGYLTDLALTLRRRDDIERMIRLIRRTHPRARVGLHTNMPSEALNALCLISLPVDDVSLLSSPRTLEADSVNRLRRAGVSRITAEVGLAPSVVHRAALRLPSVWTHGADSILLGAAADPDLSREREANMKQVWQAVFPGVPLPDAAW